MSIYTVEGKEHVYNGKTTALATFRNLMLAQIFVKEYERLFGIKLRIVEIKG